MTRKREKLIEDVLGSELAADWQTQLVDSFFDDDAKREIIREIRQSVSDRCSGRKPEETKDVQTAVVARLIGLASRDASPPKADVETPPDLLSGTELEDEIISRYPYPIAVPYRVLTEQESSAAAFGCLLDTFEGLVHYLATVAVSAYLRSGIEDPTCNRRLLETLVKNAWSTGDLYSLLLHPLKVAGDCSGQLPYTTLPMYLFQSNGKPSTSNRVLQSFVTLRNRAWGHSAGRDEAFYASILAANRARLDEQLARLHCLTTWDLVRPIMIDDSAVVRKVDQLMGDRRRKGRADELCLDAKDLPQDGGDVRAEKSILLVSPDRERYLPLYPLSLFGFKLRSQGMYFLQRPQWEQRQQRRRLTKVHYVAYESGLGTYEEGPGEPATQSLERVVHGLVAGMGEDVAVAPERAAETASAEDPDVELPEVVHEQQFHLRSFAGREAILDSYAAWIEARQEGGYLLILGPPGQGKSAVMAQLAHREGERGCLLHMVKSHRNPRRFLPSLIRQAASLLGIRFGEGAYQGDIDDLRNSLVKAAEAMKERFGRALIIIDALDELETSEGRVRFLPSSLPPGVRVILTCRPDIPLVQAVRSRVGQLNERKLPPLSEDDLPALLGRRFEAEPPRRLHNIVDWNVLFRRLQGNPLFLQRALDLIELAVQEAHAAGGLPKIDLDSLPASLEDLFLDIYNEIAAKRAAKYTSAEGRQRARLIQFLCLAREPLGFEQLAELMDADGTGISLEECRDRVCEMSQYLLDVGGNRFKPWHQGLGDYIRKAILGQRGLEQTESVFCQWVSSPSNRRKSYALRYRVSHLISAQRWEELEEMLTNLSYLEAKTEVGLVFELAGDFTAAVNALPADRPNRRILRLLGEALRRDVHFIAQHTEDYPQALFQCLWNTCWWYDCPKAPQHFLAPLPLGEGRREGGSETRQTSDARGPWSESGPKLSELLESWRADKQRAAPCFVWVRSLRPPSIHLGTAQLALLRGHEETVTSVSFSPDGRCIASGSQDDTVCVWDAVSGAELAVFRGHQQPVYSVSFSPDGLRIATGSRDQTVRVWDVESGAELTCSVGHQRTVESVAFSSDGRRIASGSLDRTVRVWDTESGAELAILRGHKDSVYGVSFSPDGRRIVSGSGDKTLRVWDTESGAELAILRGHKDSVYGVSFSPDGRRIVSGSRDRTLRVWDAESGAELAILRGHKDSVYGVSFSPDGRRIASGSHERTVRVWDAESGAELVVLRGHERWIQSVSFSPDGRRIASGSGDRTARVWDAEGGAVLAVLRGHDWNIHSVSFSPDGQRIATGSWDQTVRVWDAESGAELACSVGHQRSVECVAFSADGQRIASGSEDKTVRVWDAESGAELAVLRGHRWSVKSVSFSADGRRIASASEDKTVRVWDTESGTELAVLRGHENSVHSASFSLDGQRIVSGSWDKTVRVWDAEGGAELAVLRGHENSVHTVKFSLDGRRIASGSEDNTVRMWDAETYNCLEVIEDSSDAAAIACGATEPHLCALARGQETVIEEVATGRAIARFPVELSYVRTHPNGRTWAASVANHLYILTLEGTSEPADPQREY